MMELKKETNALFHLRKDGISILQVDGNCRVKGIESLGMARPMDLEESLEEEERHRRTCH